METLKLTTDQYNIIYNSLLCRISTIKKLIYSFDNGTETDKGLINTYNYELNELEKIIYSIVTR